ncbi:MAG TPA: HAD-IA family hydrolase [Vicinamibacterales bacterium]|jgi:phosphoglycolate phosphatase
MQLVVFDLDGTIIDSRRDLADSTNEMLATYGAAPHGIDDIALMIGDGAKKLVERALAAAGLDPFEPDALDRFREIYDRRLLATTRPYEGMIEVLGAAGRRTRLALLSNKPELPTRRILDALDLARYFSWIIGGDSGFERKPDPASLEFLIRQSGATPASTLFVGDSAIDAETARRAGAALCLVDFGFGKLPASFALRPGESAVSRAADVGRAIDRFLQDGRNGCP